MGVEFESVFDAAWRRWGVVHYVAVPGLAEVSKSTMGFLFDLMQKGICYGFVLGVKAG